ncbi:MAG: hypothetical protein PHD95_06610, partial [Candidatus ainarchaeum sp.]|nr:hypothetical protein [Candidatus ainarchaeum sp.]
MKKFSTSAGSFAIGKKKPRKVTTYIHTGGKAACGGGKALCVENLAATAKNVSGFAQSIGWSDKAGETIGRAIRKMPLSADP